MAVERARAMLSLKKGHFEHDNERLDKYTLGDELPTKLSELSLRRPLPAEMGRDTEDFTIRTLTRDDYEEVLHFLRKFFFRDEPLNITVQLLETPDSRCMALEEYAMASVDDGVSVVAVDRHGDIIGVVINGIARKDESIDVAEKVEQCTDEKFKRILRVLGHLDAHANLRKHAGDCDILEVRIASTHEAHRGRGLMRRLCEKTEALALQSGCGALRMDATSAFSAAAAERLRYTRVYSVAYADIDGAPVPDPPHTHASVYVKKI